VRLALFAGGLALRYLRESAPAPHPAIPALYITAGTVSLAVLLAALDHTRPHGAMGLAGFCSTSAALSALTLLVGLVVAPGRVARAARGTLVGAHAGVAIAVSFCCWR
jgi:hypothetical protein